jgi:hypothetical protein
MNMTGFGVTALDAELDGDLDIMIANGRVVRGDPVSGSPLAPPWDRFPEHNLFYLNDGRGKFQTAGREGGEIVSRLEITRCLTSADLDADGDLDVVLTNIEGPARVYRNEAARGGHWLMVRAVDPTLNREAIGARVVVSAGGRKWVRSITRTSGYLCATDARAHFGLGVADGVDDIHVQWPGGAEERFEGSPADRVITVVRGRGTSAP